MAITNIRTIKLNRGDPIADDIIAALEDREFVDFEVDDTTYRVQLCILRRRAIGLGDETAWQRFDEDMEKNGPPFSIEYAEQLVRDIRRWRGHTD